MKSNHLLLGVLVIISAGVFILSGCSQRSTNPAFSTIAQQSGNQTASSPASFLAYDNPVAGIRIKYPPEWAIQENFMGTIVLFRSPKEYPGDQFQENVNVLIENLSGQSITLDEYRSLSTIQLERLITDYALVEQSQATIDGNPAYKSVFTGREGQYSLKWMQVYTIKDNKAYVITYTAEPDEYPVFYDTATQMMDSFKFT